MRASVIFFVVDPSASGRVWGHAPPREFLKLDTSDWLKLTEKCNKSQEFSPIFYLEESIFLSAKA